MARITDSGRSVNPFTTQLAPSSDRTSTHPLDRNISIDELRVLKLRRDVLAPADAQSLLENGRSFLPAMTSGDSLRLHQLTRHNGIETRAAIHRIIAADTSGVAGSAEARTKEQRMLRVLVGIKETLAQIQSRSVVRL